MICPVCGNEIHEGEKFCGNCGASVVSMPEDGSAAVVERRKGLYNVDGIIGFGLMIPYVIIVAINVLVFLLTYTEEYVGNNPLVCLIGIVFPLICLIFASGGFARRKQFVKGNRLTMAGFVISIIVCAAFLAAFLITLSSCIATVT